MNPELIQEYSKNSRFFALAGVFIGLGISICSLWVYANFIMNPDTHLKPGDLQAGHLLGLGLLVILACLSPWVQGAIQHQESELEIDEQNKKFTEEIVRLNNRLATVDQGFSEEYNAALKQKNKLLEFFKKWDRYGFNIPRIRDWGSKQEGFGFISEMGEAQLRHNLNLLLSEGKIRTRLSTKGSVLYQAQNKT